MSQVVETVDVDVPVDVAYNQWTQFEEFPRFLSFVESIAQIDDTHLHWRVKIGGVEREFDAEVTEQHPDERIAWNSIGGDENHAGVVTFHRLNDAQTRIAVQLDWEPTGVAEKAGAALGIDSRAVRKDLENFASFIESRGAETGEWRGDVS
ncbi:SRPBCC family protein [Microbacterium sp. SORGH_AS_0862]|uniref:SRPBCC family protein n=1 Tax=Microbacterium sp. SORGH_AS_0862 TaxID=3041789 RepID=UPI00278F87DD|nr:SRPBCC family protein [Microbacterium sp. SORGH_AS_0862]MDQ1206000.1 putative membrane protein [Microbacterium sp. SORGH_AS_0862]